MSLRASLLALLTCLLTCLLSACANNTSDTASHATEQPNTAVIKREFVCSEQQQLKINFFPETNSADLFFDGKKTSLQQQLSGSGFAYAGGAYSVRGKGQQFTLSVNDGRQLMCKQVNP
ncbi:MliC family protein [Agaribacterium haliotis]|uniref:MliC family protein n=1 Tax=Agaribacterium haliotis TaxID=2013869 RepID=UPI0013040699|nr:MliC family protein [Agaribacterium haliotis]